MEAQAPCPTQYRHQPSQSFMLPSNQRLVSVKRLCLPLLFTERTCSKRAYPNLTFFPSLQGARRNSGIGHSGALLQSDIADIKGETLYSGVSGEFYRIENSSNKIYRTRHPPAMFKEPGTHQLCSDIEASLMRKDYPLRVLLGVKSRHYYGNPLIMEQRFEMFGM